MKILIFIFIFLAGCSANNIQEKTNMVIDDKFGNSVSFPDDLDLSECPDFPIFKGKNAADLYKFVISDVSKKYYECANKAKLSQEFIKKVYKK